MRSKLLTTTVAALLLGGASLAHAQDTGFYAGAGAGQALVDKGETLIGQEMLACAAKK